MSLLYALSHYSRHDMMHVCIYHVLLYLSAVCLLYRSMSSSSRVLPPSLILQRLSIAHMADCNLLYLSLVIPLANLSFFLLLPSFDVTRRHWTSFFAFLASAGSCAADLPILHTLVQWIISLPAFLCVSKGGGMVHGVPQPLHEETVTFWFKPLVILVSVLTFGSIESSL